MNPGEVSRVATVVSVSNCAASPCDAGALVSALRLAAATRVIGVEFAIRRPPAGDERGVPFPLTRLWSLGCEATVVSGAFAGLRAGGNESNRAGLCERPMVLMVLPGWLATGVSSYAPLASRLVAAVGQRSCATRASSRRCTKGRNLARVPSYLDMHAPTRKTHA